MSIREHACLAEETSDTSLSSIIHVSLLYCPDLPPIFPDIFTHIFTHTFADICTDIFTVAFCTVIFTDMFTDKLTHAWGGTMFRRVALCLRMRPVPTYAPMGQ